MEGYPNFNFESAKVNASNPYTVIVLHRLATPSEMPPVASTLPPSPASLKLLEDAYPVFVAQSASGVAGTHDVVASGQISLNKHYFRVRSTTWDNNGNGVSDYYQLLEQYDPAQFRTLDTDGDGRPDWKEVAAGSDPHDKLSTPESTWIPGSVTEGTVIYPTITGKFLKGIDHSFGYQVQYKASGSNVFVDLDMDTSILSITPDTKPNYEEIRFKIPTGGTAGMIQYKLKSVSQALAYPTTSIVSGTLRAHSNACIQEMIPSLGFASLRNVFERTHSTGDTWPTNTTFNDQSSSCKWFRWGLTPRINLSGVAWDSEFGYSISELNLQGIVVPAGPPPATPDQTYSQCEITLVSPRHGLAAWHMTKDYFRTTDPPPAGLTLDQNQKDRLAAGAKMIVYDLAGRRSTRTIKSISQVLNTDIAVVTFYPDLDPNYFKIYPVLPPRKSTGQVINWVNLLGQGTTNPTACLSFNREREVGIYKIKGIGVADASTNLYAAIGVDSAISAELRWPVRGTPFNGPKPDWAVSGDSSGPVFLLYRGNAVLIGHNTYGGTTTNAVYTAWHLQYFDQINSVMATNVPGAATTPAYQLTTIPLE